jgi:alpha-L-fucosidase
MLDHENSNPDKIAPKPFLSDYSIGTGFSFSWGYTEGMEIRTEKDIVQKLIEVASMNGTLLLNLSPRADGTFPEDQKQVVTKIGRWLWTFGEGIYETRPFTVPGEKTAGGHRVHYTRKGKNVYAIFLDWPTEIQGDKTPKDTPVELRQLNAGSLGKVKSVTLLGLKNLENTPFRQTAQGLTLTIPQKTRVPSEIAQVFRIELQ